MVDIILIWVIDLQMSSISLIPKVLEDNVVLQWWENEAQKFGIKPIIIIDHYEGQITTVKQYYKVEVGIGAFALH